MTSPLRDRKSSRQTLEAVAVIAWFTGLTVLMTFPLVAHLGDSLPSDLGDPLLNTWILAWDADRLLHGLQGFWDAPMFYPYARTLTYSEHLLGVAVLTAPFQWLFDNPVGTYNFAFLLSYVLAGSGMYLLARQLTGNRMASTVAGMAFAFCPFRILHVGHLQVLLYGWMPIGLWALHRYFASGSRRALGGFLVSFVLLAWTNGYYLYFFCIPVSIVAISEIVRHRERWQRSVTDLAVTAALFVVAMAPFAFAYMQTHADQGLVRTRDLIARYSADVVSYVQIPGELKVWQGILQAGPGEAALFPGLTVLCLALIAVMARDRLAPPPGPDSPLSTRHVVALYAGIGFAAFFLSLGPEPSWSGRTALLSTGPYDWLLAVVPGLDGLRVPSRLASVVYLSLAVLGAVGFSALAGWLSRPVGTTLAVIVAASILVEGYRGPMPLARFVPDENADEQAAYAWLRGAEPGGMIELPIVEAERYPLTLRYVFNTLQHGHPIVNGYSGYDSRLNSFLTGGSSPLSELAQVGGALRGLRAQNVRYVTVHLDEYRDREFGEATLGALRRQRGQIRQTQVFGETTVLELMPWNEPTWTATGVSTPISLLHFRATASHRGNRLSMAFDGDPATRWLTGRRQMGDEWIQIQFDSPRDVARVRLAMAQRSLGDYPRILTVESSSDGELFQTLYDGSPLPQLLEGIVTHLDDPPIDLTLPPNRTLTLRLRQRGRTRSFYWSIHELQLWER